MPQFSQNHKFRQNQEFCKSQGVAIQTQTPEELDADYSRLTDK